MTGFNRIDVLKCGGQGDQATVVQHNLNPNNFSIQQIIRLQVVIITGLSLPRDPSSLCGEANSKFVDWWQSCLLIAMFCVCKSKYPLTTIHFSLFLLIYCRMMMMMMASDWISWELLVLYWDFRDYWISFFFSKETKVLKEINVSR